MPLPDADTEQVLLGQVIAFAKLRHLLTRRRIKKRMIDAVMNDRRAIRRLRITFEQTVPRIVRYGYDGGRLCRHAIQQRTRIHSEMRRCKLVRLQVNEIMHDDNGARQ